MNSPKLYCSSRVSYSNLNNLKVIASVAGWMAIVFGNFFKTGDRVQLGGIKGDVIDIGVLRTTIMETGQ